jgi:hypothetical protein
MLNVLPTQSDLTINERPQKPQQAQFPIHVAITSPLTQAS